MVTPPRTVNPNGRKWAKEFSDWGFDYFLSKHSLVITDGFRTGAQQSELRLRKPNLASKGPSLHELGLAFDVEVAPNMTATESAKANAVQRFYEEPAVRERMTQERADEAWHFVLKRQYWSELHKRLSAQLGL